MSRNATSFRLTTASPGRKGREGDGERIEKERGRREREGNTRREENRKSERGRKKKKKNSVTTGLSSNKDILIY